MSDLSEHGAPVTDQLGPAQLDSAQPVPDQLDLVQLQAAVLVLEQRLSEQSRAAQEQAAALDAFIAFSQASTATTDVHALARQAVRVLRQVLGQVSVVYYDLSGKLWKAGVLSEDIAPDVAAELQAGVPVTAPSYAEAARSRQAVFISGWNAQHEGVATSDAYGAGAMFPCFVGDELSGMLGMGIQHARAWTSLEQRVFQAVGSSLALALGRSVLSRRREEGVQAVFARFTTRMATTPDLETLVGVVAEIIRDGVSDSACVYYHYQAGRFVPLYFSANVPPAVRAGRAGHFDMTLPVVARAFATGEAAFTSPEPGQVRAAHSKHFQALGAVPYFSDGQPYGLLGLASVRRGWTEREQALLRSVGQGLGLALTRLAQTQALELEREALNTFVAFTEAADGYADLGDLTAAAFGALSRLFPGCGATLLEWSPAAQPDQLPSAEPNTGLWKSRQHSASLSAALAAVIVAGLPPQTPILAQMTRSGAPVFVDGWTPETQGVAHTGHFESAAVYPVTQGGTVVAALSVGIEGHRHWQPRERAILSAIGRSFTLLYDRFQAAERLTAQKREAESRAQTLEIFARLITELRAHEDRYGLISRAQDVMFRMLPPGHSVYWEREGERWRARTLSGDFGKPELQRTIEAGLSIGATPTLDQPWAQGQAVYQDQYLPGSDVSAELSSHLHSVVAFPVRLRGAMQGLLSFVTLTPHTWRALDRAVLSTLVESLELALERAQSVAELAERSKELELSNAELKAANEELEAFASSASHDLRTPVRHVKGFAELARKALGSGNTDKAAQHLGVIEGAADRMSALIDALLLLSRSTRQALRQEQVPLPDLVEQAMRDVAQDLSGRAVDWRLGELPVILGDPATLQQVMTNLIANAVKFTARSPLALIEIWAERQNDTLTVHVRDNGVGFDPAYQSKLFGVFQRLHSEREFGGTGVGLATVRRIILRHGGRVWAHSELDKGATFSFSLPVAP